MKTKDSVLWLQSQETVMPRFRVELFFSENYITFPPTTITKEQIKGTSWHSPLE
jgi:hypothetical protein